MERPSQTTVFSGIQPSGYLHLGNYLGAISQWVDLQEDNTAYYCIVDLHAITVPYEPKKLPHHILDAAALYLAAGIDPQQSTLFIQSHVPAHTELAWLLATQTPFGELSRMTQFKDKSEAHQSDTTLGLFAYPTLMAADILLYQTAVVPVGEDQVQHLELARDIAKRFNNTFGETFVVPKAYLKKERARVMSLDDASKKMSKSNSAKSYIALTDEPDSIRQKIMSATTETEAVFSFADSGPAVLNLMRLYQGVTAKSQTEIETEFSGSTYKVFKETLAEAIIEHLSPLQERFRKLRADEQHLQSTLASGADTATDTANKTLTAVKKKMGLLS